MRTQSFVFRGGPHDGDRVAMPLATVPTSKSLVIQDHKGKLGVLHKYFFNKLLGVAVYQGAVNVAPDGVN